jgi:signal transduction histidine kinase
MAFLPRLRLGHKLALSLSLAALLPVIVAASVAVKLVLRGLEEGLRDQTDRQLRVGMNLVLRTVEKLGGDAERLASMPALAESIDEGADAVSDLLAREDPHLPSSLVEIADPSGKILATRAIGGDQRRFAGLEIAADSPLVASGLEFERRVTLGEQNGMIVVHAVSPVVDPSYRLKGVVIETLPLDSDFADEIKGALSTDVLIHAGAAPANSSFIRADGSRLTCAPDDASCPLKPPKGVAVDVLAGGTRQATMTIDGREYNLGYAPLKSLDGKHVGMFAVAVGRGALAKAKTAAARSLGLGLAGAFAFALGVAGVLSRRLTRPIQRLHAGALAIARGELDVRLNTFDAGQGDEIGDLASAFTTMTMSLREGQERLAARMREIVALHEAGRAVSSVLGLDEVLRKIVDSIARVLDTRLAALWLVEAQREARQTGSGVFAVPDPFARPALKIGAARARITSGAIPERLLAGIKITDAEQTLPRSALSAEKLAEPLGDFAAAVAQERLPVRIDDVDVSTETKWREAAKLAAIDGSLLAVPLERGKIVVGVLVVGRGAAAAAFTDADENLLATFADQAATAIENARLYEELRAFSEELEEKVRVRTAELTKVNAEVGRALAELRDTQSQLILSERMAGLGALVAGVAHEINSPSAAIRGSVDALAENVRRLATSARELGELHLNVEQRTRILSTFEELAPKLAERKVGSPVEVRRRARSLAGDLEAAGVVDASDSARALVEIGAEEAMADLLPLFASNPPQVIVGYLREYTYLHRNAGAIQTAIKQIQRIVGALKSYSHLDQAKIETADVHDGIENTLAILHHELKYGISIVRRYGALPKIPVYVDELNQVWTNLIHNAVQALRGKGEIVIETRGPAGSAEDHISVMIVDNGPGIPTDVMPRIFEPFFTTKAKGEGTGLGLGIVRKIVDKHGGTVEVASEPGRTCFTVKLPLSGPPVKVPTVTTMDGVGASA